MFKPKMIVEMIYNSGKKEKIVLEKPNVGDLQKLLDEASDVLKTYRTVIHDPSQNGTLKFTWNMRTKFINVKEIASLDIEVVKWWEFWK